MSIKGFCIAWLRLIGVGLRILVAGMATGIVYGLAVWLAHLFCNWLFPGWIAGIPDSVAMWIRFAFGLLVALPLFAYFFVSMDGMKPLILTKRGEVRDGKWRRRQAVE